MTEPHAVTRAREHYGLELTAADLRIIALRCQAGRDVVLMARHRDRSVYLVRYKDKAMKAVVTRDGYVKTFLAPHYRLKYITGKPKRQRNKKRHFGGRGKREGPRLRP